MQAQATGKVVKFNEFFVRDGELMGKIGEEEYVIDYILNNGGGQTYVAYFDDGEWQEIVQNDTKGFVNTRIYG